MSTFNATVRERGDVINYRIYACPKCKGELSLKSEKLHCQTCHRVYPIVEGIPSFILDDSNVEANPSLPLLDKLLAPVVAARPPFRNYYDAQARTYELTRYPVRLLLYGGIEALSFKQLIRTISQLLEIGGGRILDVACGPLTLGRRLTAPSRAVYGTDLSMGMLRQGAAYVHRERRSGVNLAQASVEALPFPDEQFDAAVCGDALKLFPDPLLALKEIGRSLRVGAPLIVSTIVATNRGIFRWHIFREHSRRHHIRIFQLSELQELLTAAGFRDFQYQLYGSMIIFKTFKT